MAHIIRTLGNQPDLPVPAGAVAGEWTEFTGVPGNLLRYLTWSRHDAAGVVVAVEGAQHADGQVVDPFISLYGNTEEFTAAQARRLAAALLDAADALDGLR